MPHTPFNGLPYPWLQSQKEKMTQTCHASRLYMPGNQIDSDEKIGSWVEIKLSDQFLDRVLELHTLVTHHQLESVTASIEASWHLESNWVVEKPASDMGLTIQVFDWGFIAECRATAGADADLGQKERHSVFQAVYLWGAVTELVADWRPTTDFPRTCFEKAGGWESDGEEAAFRHLVINDP